MQLSCGWDPFTLKLTAFRVRWDLSITSSATGHQLTWGSHLSLTCIQSAFFQWLNSTGSPATIPEYHFHPADSKQSIIKLSCLMPLVTEARVVFNKTFACPYYKSFFLPPVNNELQRLGALFSSTLSTLQYVKKMLYYNAFILTMRTGNVTVKSDKFSIFESEHKEHLFLNTSSFTSFHYVALTHCLLVILKGLTLAAASSITSSTVVVLFNCKDWNVFSDAPELWYIRW